MGQNTEGRGTQSDNITKLRDSRVVRYPPTETDKERDAWFQRMEREIQRQLDELYIYGEDSYTDDSHT